jgi:hypothetical protein
VREAAAWSGHGFVSGAVTMRAILVIALPAILIASCTPDNDVTGSVNACTAKLYSSFNPKDIKQCVGACTNCDRGTTITCTTSCTLKGAH